MAREPSSSAPTLNTPTTFKRCNRGVTPPAALLRSGIIRVSLSPRLRRKRRAVTSPTTTPNSPGSRSAKRPCCICSAMIETCGSSCGSMPLIWIGCIAPLNESMPSNSVKGTAAVTCGCFRAAAATGCQSSNGCAASRLAWGTMPRIRVLISFWKPFITESTTIIASTPRARPIIEVRAINEMKWLRRLARV